MRYQSCGCLLGPDFDKFNGLLINFEFCVLCFQWMSCLLHLDIDCNKKISLIRIGYDLICKMHNLVMCGGGPVSKHLGANDD